jgi:hypothetical protein
MENVGGPAFVVALRALASMKAEGIIEEYAVTDAMALVFWAEPIPTFDLDVLVFLPEEGGAIVSLDRIYRWAASRGYAAEAEHVLIGGVPVQFLPSHNELADEAIETAATVDYEGVDVRVVRPEHLVALYCEPPARTGKRRERAMALVESGKVDRAKLEALLARFGLEL